MSKHKGQKNPHPCQEIKNNKAAMNEMKEETAVKAKKTEKNLSIPATGSNQNEKYMWLNTSQLQISPDIQRKLDPMRVSEIVHNFSPLVANPIKVSFRDGKYYIFDGMHTWMALRRLNDAKDFQVFCRVYFGLAKEDEARLFAAQFGISQAVPMPYRLRALAVAKDQEVLDFIKITRNSGFGITLGSHTATNGRIAAVCEAFKVFQSLGGDGYSRMLKILHRTWAGENWSVTKNMLGGMARFMKMYEITANSFVKTFRDVSGKDITAEADRFTGMSKEGAFAMALAEIYDRKCPDPVKRAA